MDNEEISKNQEKEIQIESYFEYMKGLARYNFSKEIYKDEKLMKNYKEELNSCVKDCQKKLPKSLIDKLKIEKIE